VQGKLQGGAPIGINGSLMDDGGNNSVVTTGVPFGMVAPDAAPHAARGSVGPTVFVPTLKNGGGGRPPRASPNSRATIFQRTAGLPSGAATYYEKGKITTFIALGDPTVPQFLPDSSTFNGLTFHVLAYPNDPPVVPAN